MRVEIPLLGCELPVRTGEQQLVRDEALQFLDVGSELRSAQARLERDNLRIWIADEDSFLRDASGSGYRSR